MRPDLRPLADHRAVDMGDHAAAGSHAVCGIGQEDPGIRALPLRIGRREMRADVAVRQRAEDGVGNGVHQHVGVGMALQLAVVRDGDTAEPDGVAVLEGVDVVALADADVGEVAGEAALGGGEVAGRGDLHVGGVSVENVDAMAGALGDGGVVGQFLAGGGAVGGED